MNNNHGNTEWDGEIIECILLRLFELDLESFQPFDYPVIFEDLTMEKKR